MKPLPSYAATTTWETGQYLIEWTPNSITFGKATVGGRAVNTGTRILYAYASCKAAIYKLKELRGEVKPPAKGGYIKRTRS